VQLVIIAALFGIGGMLLGLHYNSFVRVQLSNWILEPNESFLLIGYLVLGTALILSICFGMMQRNQYLRLEMRGKEFFIDEALIKQTIRQFWRLEFPNLTPPEEIYFVRQKIEVVAEVGDCDLEEIEMKLGTFLSQKLGYEKQFYVTLTV
jgi:hypothetical protein